MVKRVPALVLSAVVLTGAGGSCDEPSPPEGPVTYSVEVEATLPHDPDAFTQGFEVIDNRLFLESTGLYGQSTLRLVERQTGAVTAKANVSPEYFAEGATVVGDHVWQLTWIAGTALRYELDTLTPVGEANYEGQGWGLCYDETADRLIGSNGSSQLTFRDPDTFEETGSILVTDEGEQVSALNELECVDGKVWANRWRTPDIVEIDPSSGAVVGRLDVSDLIPDGVLEADPDNVANGIAYDNATGRFFLTGKRWPVVYEISLDVD